jgi:undecaprenyl-phosphate 4-deoxy-4-formamido-L-arabinose transferase
MLSVVIPVYNSERILPLLCGRLEKVCSPLGTFELILVNDGSRDNSWRVIQESALNYQWIRGINLMRNYGQHNALLCGIRAARYDVIVTMDDDLQNAPEEIPDLLKELANGYDVVYGYSPKQSGGALRNLASIITKVVLQHSMGARNARRVSSFRAFRRQTRDAFRLYRAPFVSIDVLLTWGAQRFSAIPVRNDPRAIGASNYRTGQLVTHAINMMTGFSTAPLRLASMIGFAAAAFGAVVLGFVLSGFLLHGRVVPGFTFLASLITIFAGTQLFTLGIMGEYLCRVHFRVLDKPSYTIDSSTEKAQ